MQAPGLLAARFSLCWSRQQVCPPCGSPCTHAVRVGRQDGGGTGSRPAAGRSADPCESVAWRDYLSAGYGRAVVYRAGQ